MLRFLYRRSLTPLLLTPALTPTLHHTYSSQVDVDSILGCSGCGIDLQTEDKSDAGYIPPSVFDAYAGLKPIVCYRCARLAAHGDEGGVYVGHARGYSDRQMGRIPKKKAGVVLVADAGDLEGSLLPNRISSLVGPETSLVIAVNKADTLPHDGRRHTRRLATYVRSRIRDLWPDEFRSAVRDVLFVSATKRTRIGALADAAARAAGDGDLYFVGAANVGKSSLVNAIRGLGSHATTIAPLPGTTLKSVPSPMASGANAYDTPGLLKDPSVSLAMFDALPDPDAASLFRKLKFKSPIVPRPERILPTQHMSLAGGVVKLGFSFDTGVMAASLYAHPALLEPRGKVLSLLSQAKHELRAQSRIESSTIYVPYSPSSFRGKIKSVADICIPGFGWIALGKGATPSSSTLSCLQPHIRIDIEAPVPPSSVIVRPSMFPTNKA